MLRKLLPTLVCLALVLLLVGSSILALRVWTPDLKTADACRQRMEQTEGYGPWHLQSAQPLTNTQARTVVITYFDGFNTASCTIHQYGPIWIVVSIDQTLVGCGKGLSATTSEACPRGKYGVIP